MFEVLGMEDFCTLFQVLRTTRLSIYIFTAGEKQGSLSLESQA